MCRYPIPNNARPYFDLALPSYQPSASGCQPDRAKHSSLADQLMPHVEILSQAPVLSAPARLPLPDRAVQVVGAGPKEAGVAASDSRERMRVAAADNREFGGASRALRRAVALALRP